MCKHFGILMVVDGIWRVIEWYTRVLRGEPTKWHWVRVRVEVEALVMVYLDYMWGILGSF